MVRMHGLGWLVAVAMVAACSSSPGHGPGLAPEVDAGVDGAAPDAPRDDAGVPGDAMVDAPTEPTSPFPADPQGGEFAWVVSGSGASAENAVIDSAGSIVVAAVQSDVVKLGTVTVPRPASGKAVVVVKLTADGAAIWGHAFPGNAYVTANALATTPAGDVIVSGTTRDGSWFNSEGFVAVLDGATGVERWSATLASKSDDDVAGVAATTDAIYAYGSFGTAGEIAGRAVPAGGYLVRYDLDGAVRWVRSLPVAPHGDNALALDPVRGLVGVGNFAGEIVLGSQAVVGRGSVVVGLDLDGGVRFVRPVLSDAPAAGHHLAIAPAGDVYVASSTVGTEVVIGNHVIPYVDYPGHPYLLRLAADGQFMAARQITGDQASGANDVAIDASGAAYMAMSCNGRVDVQPEISCADARGGVIASYGPNNAYRWATLISSAHVNALAAAPGNRMIVAGEATTAMTNFGGVVVPTQSLFIAALAGGPARAPTTLPAKPALASAALDGVPDGQIRQGDTGTLVIRGAALDQVTSAKLGGLDVHIRAGAATADELRLSFMIPHGYAPGPLDLKLVNLAGSASLPAVITVTPIVVAANGSEAGRGTYASPMSLCRKDGFYFARYGDLVLLQNGKHECASSVSARSGVTFRGESKEGAIVTGPNNSSSKFGGFYVGGDAYALGVAAIENVTITSASYQAINHGSGTLAVTDVDIIGAYGSGIWVAGGYARVNRYRYLQGQSTAIVVGLYSGAGRVEATDVTVEDAYRGVLMERGSVSLTRATMSTTSVCVQAGNENSYGDDRLLQIDTATLRSNAGGVRAGLAEIEISGASIEPASATDYTYSGIWMSGGGLTVRDSQLSGWQTDAIYAIPHWSFAVPGASANEDGMSVLLDNVDISNSGFGLYYIADVATDRLSVHGSRINTRRAALDVSGPFTADLGTAAVPGNNQLTSSNGAALYDARSTAGPAIDAHGTTLNGADLSGDVLGPVSDSLLKIYGPNTIRF